MIITLCMKHINIFTRKISTNIFITVIHLPLSEQFFYKHFPLPLAQVPYFPRSMKKLSTITPAQYYRNNAYTN